MESTVQEQIFSVTVLVKNAILWLYGDTDRATDSRLHKKVISLIQVVVARVTVNSFCSAVTFKWRWSMPYISVWLSPILLTLRRRAKLILSTLSL